MSGEKCAYIRIRGSEYNRMLRACRNQENLDALIGNISDKISKAIHNIRDQWRSAVKARYESADARIASMSDEIRRMETEHTERLRDQSERFQHSMDDMENRFTTQGEEFARLIRLRNKAFSRTVDEQRRDLEQKIARIAGQMAKQQKSEQESAAVWIADASTMAELIASDYRCEKFQPGAAARIEEALAISRDNFERGLYQTAVASAQQTYLEASRLRLDLEELEAEWQTWLETAQQNAVEVLALCDAQTVCRFIYETEEGVEDIDAEINFWTEGDLERVTKDVESEIYRLESPEELSIDDLKSSVNKSEKWRGECLELAETARERLLASQIRNNIGKTIEHALEDAGWTITDATYEAEDFRRAVHVKFENLSGDEIVTVVSPVQNADETIENKIEISFFDRSTNDDAYRRERLKAIKDMFNRKGLEITEPVCLPGTENKPADQTEKLDFERIRQPLSKECEISPKE